MKQEPTSLNNYKESCTPNKQQRSMLSTTKLQWSCAAQLVTSLLLRGC